MEVWTFEGLLWRCEKAGIRPIALLKRAGVSPGNLYCWKRGSVPNTGTMKKIMDAMAEVQRELGMPEDVRTRRHAVEVWSFAELVRRCEEAGVAPLAVLRRAGVNKGGFFAWRAGRLPKVETMLRVMKAFPEEARRVERLTKGIWTFEELLRRCREAGIKPSPLLKRAGVEPSNLTHWKRGKRPKPETMRKVMKAFPEEAARAKELRRGVWTVAELLRRCAEAGIRPSPLLRRAGMEPCNLTFWKRGGVPRPETMERIMRAFQEEARRAAMSNQVATSDRKSSRPQGTVEHAGAALSCP